MKTKLTMISLALVLTMIFGTFTYAGETLVGSGAAAEQETYTLEEMLQYALEDERMAQAEYAAIMEAFDVTRPFSNIEKAEVQHESAVITLYEARGLEVPDFDPEGYIVLPDTLEETFEIGVQAEINNIAMYDAFLEQELDEDVRIVFQALRDGSVNHLAAFENGLSGNGGTGNGNRSSNGRKGNNQGTSNGTSIGSRNQVANNEKETGNFLRNNGQNGSKGNEGICILD